MYLNTRILLSALVALVCFSSCSEDFKVLAPSRPFTVVYGVLDAGEPVNYVRIQRAFGSETQSALNLAKLPDSSYFPNITVTFAEVGSGLQPQTLTRVDMATEGYTKDPGEFFTTPNYAYKITQQLTPGKTYRLLIKNNDNGNVDTAETAIVDLTNTSISEFIVSTGSEQKLELTPTSSTNTDSDRNYSWRVVSYPASFTANFMDAVVRFNFVERDVNGSAQTRKTFDYIFSSTKREANTSTKWNNNFPGTKFNNFYIAILNGLGAAPAGKERLVDSSTFIAYFGSPELYAFQQNQINIGGLGGDQIQYRYTNIRGKSTIGIFASRGKRTRTGVALTDATVAQLKTNPNTQPCNITGRVPH